MKKTGILLLISIVFKCSFAQVKWVNVDSFYQPLPASIQIYKSTDSVEGKPNIMYYAIADLNDKGLYFTADTTQNRRFTPAQYYEKNNQPLLVVNTSFFSFGTHQNFNVVVKNGKMVSYNQHSIAGRGDDTLTYRHPFFSAIGFNKKGKADVAWILSDTAKRRPYASNIPVVALHDSIADPSFKFLKASNGFYKWKMQTVVGGGPALVQNGAVNISNNIERKFAGKAINDLHPRTAMGYTKDNKLIVFVCEGRAENAAGLSLTQLAEILKNLDCEEALNLDGGGSTCMLINGKPTNTPSAKGVQRPVPSVFMIMKR